MTGHRRRALLRGGIVVATLAAVASLVVAPAWSWWSATSSVTTAVSSLTVPKAALSCRGASGLGPQTMTITWPVATVPAGTLSYTPVRTDTNASLAITTSSGTATVKVPSQLLVLPASITIRVTASVNFGSTTWTAASAQTGTVVAIVLGAAWMCGPSS